MTRKSPIRSPLLLFAALLIGTGASVAPWEGPAVAAPPGRPAEAVESSGEFEGRYRVGPTTCTVTPIKMAFAVRWAKGNRAMPFFFDGRSAEGKPVFVSEDLGKGRDRFIFDDDHYDTGRFVRADGKVFLVRRGKE